jgi:hypothetical protein
MTATYTEPIPDRADRFRLSNAAELYVLCNDRVDWLASDEESLSERPIEFTNAWEEEFAQMLDAHEIQWQYKPRTFAVEWDEQGIFVDSLTPSFYLPSRDTYLEVLAPDRICNERARKARLLREQYPGVRIELIPSDCVSDLVERRY